MPVAHPDARLSTPPPVTPHGRRSHRLRGFRRFRRFRGRSVYRRRSLVAAAARRAGGWLTLLCALVGLPAALVATRQVWWSDLDVAAAVAQPLSPPVLVLAAVATGWLLWAWLVVATVVDTAAVFTRGTRTVRLLPAPLQTTVTTLAGSLLMAITSVTAGASAAGAAPPAGAATHTAGPPTEVLPATASAATTVPDLVRASATASTLQLASTTGPGGGHTAHTTHTAHTAHAMRGQPMTVTVWHGDTLWSIAQHRLGDPHRWREIYRLNAGRYDQAGRMRGGNHIEPTWVLTLPDDAQPGTSTGHTDPGEGSATAPPAATAQPSSPPPSTTTTEQAGDDGVTGHHPSGIPSGTVTPTANPVAGKAGQPGPPGRSDLPDRSDRSDRGGVPGIGLFSGSWVDAGLAAAIVAAVALVWAHRRRRYMPRTPSASTRLDDTDVTAMPAVIRTLRRATGTATTDASTHPTIVDTTTDDEHTGSRRREDDHSDPASAPDPDPHDAAADQDGTTAADRARSGPAGRRAVGWSVGLGLVGPGADAAARGLLVTAVADGADDPAARSMVIIPAPTAVRLFGTGPALPDTPRIVITSGLPEALERLEAVTLHRSRVLQQHAVDTVAEVRHADPLEEPLPPVLLLTDTLAEDRGRVTALLAQGHRLDVHGVLLGAWPPGDTVTVHMDGTTNPATQTDNTPTTTTTDGGARHAADVGRMTVLTAAEATDLLHVLAEAHTGRPPATAGGPTTPDETSEPDTGTGQGTAAGPDPGTPRPGTAPAAVAPHPDTGDEPSPPDTAGTDREPDADTTTDTTIGTAAGAVAGDATGGVTGDPIRRVVAVDLLGTPRVVDADTSRGTLRAKSLELLAYLAVHNGAAHYESILDDLLPDAPANKAVHRLHTYISDLRQVLRRTGGADTYITRTGQRYLLNRDAFDVDLWRMRTALHTAELADDPADRIAAWQQVLHTYRGHLATGVDYEWIEPHREATRRQAVDATLALADAFADQPETVIPILDTAIRHSPYTEALYQAAMRANAAAGRLDTVRALRRTLTRQLADIDAEPSEDTTALADQLLTDTPAAARHHRREPHPNQPSAAAIPSAGHRPAPRAGNTAVHAPDRPAAPRTGRGTDTAA